MKRRVAITLLMLVFMFIFQIPALAEYRESSTESIEQSSLTKDEISKIESFVEKNMKDGKIPGASVIIVKGDKTIYNKGFGYAEIKTKRPVTPETLFELGSNSKAFTALGILKLEKEGRINLNDPVKKYIPWFEMKYTGEHRGNKINDYVDITLEQLLHHTSGIPFKSIGDIQIAEGKEALEKTVRTQVGKELDFYPGEKFLYATINYDILGLVIQQVSGVMYEEYIKKNVLEPLGLNNTYLFRDDAMLNNISTGYKVNFLRPTEYNAPIYRGNAPAGYITTNSEDLAKWIKIQLNSDSSTNFDKNLIDISHIPNRTVAPSSDGASYACGWFTFQDNGGMVSHGGNNPNYSSFILLRPQEKVGIGILTNIDSSYTDTIANGIDKIMLGQKPKGNVSDTYISIDNVSSAIVLIFIPIVLIIIYLLSVLIIEIVRRERTYNGKLKKVISNTVAIFTFITAFGFTMYNIPDVLYEGLPWSFIEVWAPQSLIIAIISLLITVAIFCIYFILTTVFIKDNDKFYFIIAILSIVSGVGNAIIIFIINEKLNRTSEFQTGLFLFFVIGITIYVYGQRLVRIRLLTLTNDFVYQKRICLINNILNSSYEKIEQVENGKIHSGLNNDTEIISNFANIIITLVTNFITLVCCFIYLGIINIYGFLVSILVIFIVGVLYFFEGNRANKLWEETRDIQNVFFKFINSLINGFKELKMNKKRKYEFRDDMQVSCQKYREKCIKSSLGFANVFVIGELLFTLVIGVVAFVFPIIFEEIQANTLRNYIFVFLYMTGPINGMLNSIPEIMRLKVSYKRLNELSKELESAEIEEKSKVPNNVGKDKFKLELIGVKYRYKNNDGEIFNVGPINYSFKSGEVTFITGGNGSGKSTLAKLIVGLYTPDSGYIYLNGNQIESEDLIENYSAIFSDFYLFEKLYGIDYKNNLDEIHEYLKILRIDDNVRIIDGKFNTIKLSTGQRKRLALLLSYLENREIYLFDEWAADQDPEFREFFYSTLIPKLKIRGKCVIAITHDDRYYNLSDNVIRMELGKIIV